MKNNIFQEETVNQVVQRIQSLNPETTPQWGKMKVAQMLAHCNVGYEMVYDDIHPKPNALMKLMLKTFVKKQVVSEKPYPKNGKTAPQFLITTDKDFDVEKERLENYIEKTKSLGEEYFDGKESHSFGKLNKAEWNNLFYKHLDHHLTQFGV